MNFYQYKAICTNVVDGDTINVEIDVGFKITTKQRLRLVGIDTPERGQVGFYEATEFVYQEVDGKDLAIVTHKTDDFGRYLAEVFVTNEYTPNLFYSLNDLLLEEGLAKPYIK
jgi:micrococcal nuclease